MPNNDMTEMLELSNNNFQTSVIKMLQHVITNMLEINEKKQKISSTNRNIQQRNRTYKVVPNGNFRTEKNVITEIKSLVIGSTAEQREQRKD